MKYNNASEFQIMESGFMETFSSNIFQTVNSNVQDPVFSKDNHNKDFHVEDYQEVPWDVYEDEGPYPNIIRNTEQKVYPNELSKSNSSTPLTNRDGSLLPFRDRFANAAVQIQKKKSLYFNSTVSTASHVPPPPPESSPFSQRSQGSISSTEDSNYVSFGNQSVTSDITESEFSLGGGSMASRDLRRKARLSKINSSFEKKSLARVKEEEEKGVRQENQWINIHMHGGQELNVEKRNGRIDFSQVSSLFGSHPLSVSKPTTTHLEEDCSEQRSKSTPKTRQVLSPPIISRSSSPPRSTDSASSSSYKGWPGTMDANGGTVSVADSNSSVSFAAARKMFESKFNTPNKFSKHAKVDPSAILVKRSQVLHRFHKAMEIENEESEDIVDLDVKPTTYLQNVPKPSDYHLAAAIATATKSLDVDTSHRTANTSMSTDISMNAEDVSFDMKSLQTTVSTPDSNPSANKSFEEIIDRIDTSASEARLRSFGRNISPRLLNDGLDSRSNSSTSPLSTTSMKKNEIRLSEDALRENERHSGSFLSFAHGANVRGYRGFFDKTADIPNLLDDESVTSASTMATNRRQDLQDTESDVFDGLSSVHGNSFIHHGRPFPRLSTDSISNKSSSASDIVQQNFVFSSNSTAVNKSLSAEHAATIQFESRVASFDIDADLTESDTDYSSNDYVKDTSVIARRGKKYDKITMPRVAENSEDSSGEFDSDSSESSFSLEKYVIDPSQTRKLVKLYRSISEAKRDVGKSLYEEDARKAFALFEMRSRIMQTDLERGFDRAGGTLVVDDIVTTDYMKASCRVRDAVIVSKAWKDGASAQEARVAYNLTKGMSYYIERRGKSVNSREHLQSVYEKVTWTDDTEFSLIRCFGVKTLRGVDIFTLGDCQSMLLKLTHEHSENLKRDLDAANAVLLQAEISMKIDESNQLSMCMSESEVMYLEAMEDVKNIQKRLKKAESAFQMVKTNIECLVEDMIEHLKKDEDSSDPFEFESGSQNEEDESVDQSKEKWSRKLQKAELKAEVAEREAQLAKLEVENTKKEAERLRVQKEMELDEIKRKLEEMEAKSSVMISDYEAKLRSQKLLNETMAKKKSVSFARDDILPRDAKNSQALLYAASSVVGTDQDNSEMKAKIKAKFRERRQQNQSGSNHLSNNHTLSRIAVLERSLESVRY